MIKPDAPFTETLCIQLVTKILNETPQEKLYCFFAVQLLETFMHGIQYLEPIEIYDQVLNAIDNATAEMIFIADDKNQKDI